MCGYVTAHGKFYQAFPCTMVVLQVTSSGVRRPEYEGTLVTRVGEGDR